MSHAPLMATDKPQPSDNTIPDSNYPPRNLPYSESFENEFMKTILYPPAPTTRLPPASPSLLVQPSALPLPLTSPLRTHPSPFPGVHLTHPGGYHTGGPGPSASVVAAFAKRFIHEQGIRSEAELERRVQEAVQRRMGEVRERMGRREEAIKRNEGVRREIRLLEAQRRTEERVEERIRAERERKIGSGGRE